MNRCCRDGREEEEGGKEAGEEGRIEEEENGEERGVKG